MAAATDRRVVESIENALALHELICEQELASYKAGRSTVSDCKNRINETNARTLSKIRKALSLRNDPAIETRHPIEDLWQEVSSHARKIGEHPFDRVFLAVTPQ